MNVDEETDQKEDQKTKHQPEAVTMVLTRTQIEKYLREVGVELQSQGLTGEILLTDGAFMTLVLRSRNSTKDVDVVPISDAAPLRAAVVNVAKRHSLPSDWLNDAVKVFIFKQPAMKVWAEYPGLRVYKPGFDYIFVMKAYSARPEDLKDLVALRDKLGLKTVADGLAIVERYIPADRQTIKTQLTIESLFQ